LLRAVHPDPLPALRKTYESTLSLLSHIPASSVYRQSVEAITQHRLDTIAAAKGDATFVENELNQGQIEEVLDAASDELGLVGKMIEWKA